MPRLFTGLEIPADIAFALSLKRGGLHGARWIDAENYHITLRFIGDVDNATAADVEASLERLANSLPFTVRLTHLGGFGGNKPHALYAGIELNDTLARLQAAHERLLQRIGLAPEGRKYTPHVTLARFSSGAETGHHIAQFMASHSTFQAGPWLADQFALYSSRQSRSGSVYREEAAYDLTF